MPTDLPRLSRNALAMCGLFLPASLSVQGCVRVHPWERELHAQRRMQVGADAETDALDQHVYDYREGASGGYGAHAGSGCGCN